MNRQQYELLVELSLAVHEMAPPDRQRSIARKFDAMIHEEQRLSYEADGKAPTTGPAEGQECEHDFEQLAEHKFRCMKCGEDFNRIWTAKDGYVGKAPVDGTEEARKQWPEKDDDGDEMCVC